MRGLSIVCLSLFLTACFMADNFDACTGPSQCGRHLGNEATDGDRFYICVDGQCVDPQEGETLVKWSSASSADEVVYIDRTINLDSDEVTRGTPLIIQHRGIIIQPGGLLDLSGAGHLGGGGGGGGKGLAQNGAMSVPMAGNGGMSDQVSPGSSGNGTAGGDGGEGEGVRGGSAGLGDRADPFIGNRCSDQSLSIDGEPGEYDLYVDTQTSFDPCGPIDLNQAPLGGGGGGGGGGRGGSANENMIGGGGGGAGGAGGGAVLLIATDFIEIRGEIHARGLAGGRPPACSNCLDGNGGDGAGLLIEDTLLFDPECGGGNGGGGSGGLVYLQAPKIIFGRDAKINVSGFQNTANAGGHVILRGEIESEGGKAEPVSGMASIVGSGLPFLCRQ